MYSSSDERQSAYENISYARPERLVNLSQVEDKLFRFIVSFSLEHQEAPSYELTNRYIESENDAPLTQLVEDCFLTAPKSGATFKEVFEQEVREQFTSHLKSVAQESLLISAGHSTLKENPKGPEEAVDYLFSTVRMPLNKDSSAAPIRINDATSYLKKEYDARETTLNSSGIMSGYKFIDTRTGGIAPKSLYFHAGFAGHLKTTLALNMILTARKSGKNVLLFTSEMPQQDVMFTLYAMYSRDIADGHEPLSQFKLLRGQLNSAEKTFFYEVQERFNNETGCGSIRVIDSADFSTWASIKARTIYEDKRETVDILWVDYLTRLALGDTGRRFRDEVSARNEDIADAKRFAMSFRKGTGLVVCSPFQINREGLKKASLNGGKFDATALYQYSSAEKEADLITYIYCDAHMATTLQPTVGIIKNRWGPITDEPEFLQIDMDSRRIMEPFTNFGRLNSIEEVSLDKDRESMLKNL